MRSDSPGIVVGVLGAGQLGRMLALAGYPLGMRFRFADESPAASAAMLAQFSLCRFDDVGSLENFTHGLHVVTYEFENVPVSLAAALAREVAVYPPPRALEVSQDRLIEKCFFNGMGIPTPAFLPVNSRDELADSVRQLSMPAVLKTRQMGYDGKGQFIINTLDDADAAWDAVGRKPLILEEQIAFSAEVSQISVRDTQGNVAHYPLVQNQHRDGLLRYSAPLTGDEWPGIGQIRSQAQDYARRVLTELDYVGVLAIEFFVAGDRLLANEMAPRVHNSGHWTIEGAETSQFENHLRAICGLPLGSTALNGHSAMLNIIGRLPHVPSVLAENGVRLHLYDKEPRAGRKLGHITVRAGTPERRDDLARRIFDLLPQ